jgi:hypothetical protein
MTLITGSEPKHWHADDGKGGQRHNMNDPRRMATTAAHWSPDEKAYVEHLKAHEQMATAMCPLDTDPDLVQTVIAYITSEDKRLASLREVVQIIRAETAAGVPLDHSQGVALLRHVWPTAPSPAGDDATGEHTEQEPTQP